MEVLDKGKGFDKSIEEPNIGEELTPATKRGWGLQIIQSLMDRCRSPREGGGRGFS